MRDRDDRDDLIARLRERGQWERDYGTNGDAGKLCDNAADALAEDAARADRAEAAIREHNDGLQASCDARAARGDCDAYRCRGSVCTDCPREWYVEYAAIAREGK